MTDKGSQTAAAAGLFHYTTLASGVKDGATTVDIGLHFVATGSDGKPLDTDGDSLVDYVEDRNGNGTYESTDLGNFIAVDSDGDGLSDDYELFTLHTGVGQADTGNTGVSDGYKDPDGDGLVNLEEFKLGRDPLQPNVAAPVFSPVGKTYPSAQTVTISSPTLGVAIRYTLTGNEPDPDSQSYSSPFNITISGPANYVPLTARAWKTGWIPSDSEYQVYYINAVASHSPPTVNISPAGGGSFLASDSIEILVEASATDGPVWKLQLYRGDFKVAEMEVEVDSSTGLPGPSPGPLRYVLNNVPAGTYTYTGKAIDWGGGAVAVTSPITITINASGPVVSLNGVQPFFTSSPGTLLASVAGVNPSAMSSLTLNGSPLVARAGEFNLNVPLVEGENTFTLVATDNQNRTGQATTKVYLDSIPPVIAITAPANNATFNTTRVNVLGTFSEASLKRITVNGVLAFISGNTFEARNVPLTAGANTVTATGEDISGNTSTATITVTGGATLVDPVQLTATPVGGFVPLNVTFQAQANVPGTLQQVLYYFKGDNGTYEPAANLNPIAHNYDSAGEYFPVVTIVTTAGRFSSEGGWNGGAGIRINVQQPPGWQSFTTVTDPVDLKVGGPAAHLYVLSRSTATIIEFDASGATIRSLAGIGNTPRGLDVDASGKVYVALTGNNQVARYTPTASSFQLDTTFNATGRIGKIDQTSGSGNGEFNAPFDVAVSPDGLEIAVSDSGNHRVQQFKTADGSFVGMFGAQGSGNGQFNTPKGLTYDGVGYLYIVDSGNNRIALALSSAVIGTSGSSGTALGYFQGAVNLCVGPRGIYVGETGNNRVQAFDPLSDGHGSAPTPFGARLSLSTELGLSQPNAIAPAADFLAEKIYIADTGNNRVIKATLPEASGPDAAWNAMKDRLISHQDIAGALAYFHTAAADQYREAFFSLGITKLTSDMSVIPALTPVNVEGDHAQYYFERTVEGQILLFPVEFIKQNGIWKVMEF